MKRTILAATLSSGLMVQSAWAMSLMSDEELADTNGQALFNLSYLSPGDTSNYEAANNIGFYRLGVEAEIAANLNIKKLQLGCGGVNGAGGCDIDIDNLSLSGNSATSNGRVQSDAILTNPFFEFAIKNPNTASTREVVGFRVSAEKAVGLLTAGLENSTTPNGINTISGFMRVQSDSTGYIYGKANTMARTLVPVANANYNINGVPTVLNNEIRANIQVAGLGGAATIEIRTIGGSIIIPAMNDIPFIRPGVVVNANRVQSLPLQATLSVAPINVDWRGVYPAGGTVVYHNPTESPINWTFPVPQQVQTQGGPLTAEIMNCTGALCFALPALGLGDGAVLQNAFLKANITGITANATINQGLGYIHSLPINSPFYLSVQKDDMRWPGSYSGPNPENPSLTVTDIAKRGWWMSFADPINLGSVDPTQPIDIAPLFPQIATQVTNYLLANPATIGFGGLVNALTGAGDINVTAANPINLSSNPLTLTLTDLQLNGQSFAPNCYGGLRFC